MIVRNLSKKHCAPRLDQRAAPDHDCEAAALVDAPARLVVREHVAVPDDCKERVGEVMFQSVLIGFGSFQLPGVAKLGNCRSECRPLGMAQTVYFRLN
jgi:hypothetical protein